MSLYSFVQLGDVTLPTGGLALLPGAQINVRVEEEQMLLKLDFQGRLTGVNGEAATLHFYVDGNPATTLPQYEHTFLTGDLDDNLQISLPLMLTKGHHVVSLWANADSGGHQVDGATVDCRFSATRVSNDAALGQGVNSKVQNVL